MAEYLVQWRQALRERLAIGVLLAGISSISGCAIPSSGVSGTDLRSDRIMTPEASEMRRRAHIRLELAANYFESGKTTIALDEVKQALIANPVYVDAYNLRGLIYMQLDDYAKAEESFKRALVINNTASGIMHNYAWLLCQQVAWFNLYAIE